MRTFISGVNLRILISRIMHVPALFGVGAILISACVCAEEDKPNLSHSPSVISPISSPALPASAPAAQGTQPDGEKPAMDKLKDGTKIEIGSDGSVSVFNTDGTKNPAPDGVLTLWDDTTFNVKNGKKVTQ